MPRTQGAGPWGGRDGAGGGEGGGGGGGMLDGCLKMKCLSFRYTIRHRHTCSNTHTGSLTTIAVSALHLHTNPVNAGYQAQ